MNCLLKFYKIYLLKFYKRERFAKQRNILKNNNNLVHARVSLLDMVLGLSLRPLWFFHDDDAHDGHHDHLDPNHVRHRRQSYHHHNLHHSRRRHRSLQSHVLILRQRYHVFLVFYQLQREHRISFQLV